MHTEYTNVGVIDSMCFSVVFSIVHRVSSYVCMEPKPTNHLLIIPIMHIVCQMECIASERSSRLGKISNLGAVTSECGTGECTFSYYAQNKNHYSWMNKK